MHVSGSRSKCLEAWGTKHVFKKMWKSLLHSELARGVCANPEKLQGRFISIYANLD